MKDLFSADELSHIFAPLKERQLMAMSRAFSNLLKPKPTMKNIKVFKSKNQWFFHVKGDNGEIICQSEGYRTKAGATKGLGSLVAVLLKDIRFIFR